MEEQLKETGDKLADGTYHLTVLSREDVESQVGVDASEISDETMKEIAQKMVDAWMSSGLYWTSLEDVWNEIIGEEPTIGDLSSEQGSDEE